MQKKCHFFKKKIAKTMNIKNFMILFIITFFYTETCREIDFRYPTTWNHSIFDFSKFSIFFIFSSFSQTYGAKIIIANKFFWVQKIHFLTIFSFKFPMGCLFSIFNGQIVLKVSIFSARASKVFLHKGLHVPTTPVLLLQH